MMNYAKSKQSLNKQDIGSANHSMKWENKNSVTLALNCIKAPLWL
jgi:hypothetical protein